MLLFPSKENLYAYNATQVGTAVEEILFPGGSSITKRIGNDPENQIARKQYSRKYNCSLAVLGNSI